MFLFGRKKKEHKTFDPLKRRPAIRSSICTGEKVAGFVNLEDGHFIEDRLIRSEEDLYEFMETYGIKEVPETIF